MTTWNEATPAGTDYISGGDNVIRDHKIAVRERMAREHYMLGSGDDANDGRHRFMCGLDAEKPTAVAGHIYVATDTLYVYVSPADSVWIALRADDPPGMIKMYGGATPPAGWLICDGNWVSRSTYSALFAVIGTTYGIGDGLNYFTLPDFKGRVPVGFDTSQAEFNALGGVGGEKTHTLTESEIPVHQHAQYVVPSFPGILLASGSGFDLITGATGPYGGGQAHNNLSPYLTVNYIIKY